MHSDHSIRFTNFALLAGNIGKPKYKNYWDFLDWCSKNFTAVFLTIGTFECEQTTYAEAVDFLTHTCDTRYKNVVFLCNELFKLQNGTIIMGSPIFSFCDNMKYVVGGSSNVARSIHNRSVNWVKSQVEAYKNSNIIILSPTLPIDLNIFNHDTLSWFHGDFTENCLRTEMNIKCVGNPFKKSVSKFNAKFNDKLVVCD